MPISVAPHLECVSFTLHAPTASSKVEFSIGDEGGDSSEVRIPVDHYFEYAVSKEAALEDNPLYLFETLSVDREQSPPRGAAAAAVDGDGGDRRVVARSGLLSDYTPSRLFSDDLFSVASSPPQYRWFLSGECQQLPILSQHPLCFSSQLERTHW